MLNVSYAPRKNKYLKGKRTRDELILCSTLAADAQLRNAATKKVHKSILVFLSRDIVAAEGHYHRSCYRAYSR